MPTWYFAYGSNLLVDQMVERIGLSVDAVASARITRLAGYRLVFQCLEGDLAAYADIIRPGLEVWGVVYRCTESDLILLDDFEQGYRRELLQVTDRSGEILEAAAYVMKHKGIGREGKPTATYLEKIITGARRHGLPEGYIAELETAARK
jgi:gamma-glutamylcyclotransferase